MRQLLYLAHPVRGRDETETAVNMAQARLYLDAMLSAGLLVIAPWIVELSIYNDADDAQRSAGLQRAVEIAARCDAVVAVGDRISAGMRLEMGACSQAIVLISYAPLEAAAVLAEYLDGGDDAND
jgi:hypothetical protein